MPVFKLVGTIITTQIKSAAIVFINDKQFIVAQGDYVEGHWKLIRAVRGQIVIRNSDQELTLRLGVQTPSTALPHVGRETNSRPRPDDSREVKMAYYLTGRAPDFDRKKDFSYFIKMPI